MVYNKKRMEQPDELQSEPRSLDILEHFISEYHVDIIWENDEPLFKASDIGNVLSLKNIRMSMAHFDSDEKCLRASDTSGGKQNLVYLTRKGMIRLIQKTRKVVPEPLLCALNIEEHRFIPPETEFCSNIRKAFQDVTWISQHHVGKYFLDLYCPTYRIMIEFDEQFHDQQIEEDWQREKKIRQILGPGLLILRFRIGHCVFEAIDEIRQFITQQNVSDVRVASEKKNLKQEIALLKRKIESVEMKTQMVTDMNKFQTEMQIVWHKLTELRQEVKAQNKKKEEQEEQVTEPAKKQRQKRPREKGTGKCLGCEIDITDRAQFCVECMHQLQPKKFETTKEELHILVHVLRLPYTTIGKKYGVSDNAIRKRCRTLGVEVRKRS